MKKIITALFVVILIGAIPKDVNAKATVNANKIPVLAYHHIVKQEYIDKTGQQKNESILSVENFEKQMQYLYENKFYIATMEELENYLDGKIQLPKKTVVITFDDGYLSNKIYAYPILKKYKQNAELFLITSLLDKPQQKFNEMEIQFLRKQDIEDIATVFHYGSHTNDMHRGVLNGLPLLVDSKRDLVSNDLKISKNILNSKYFAYPAGCNNPMIIQELKKNGYKLAFTIAPGYVSKKSDRYRLPRFPICAQKISFEDFNKIVNGKY